ncbi:MAG TPA: carboxypeptidase regulatory-like domain-containing protein [Candidatus Sulfopaludibacter sp.]|nr:carboxypeptidase regulatory-like domain-containing protein [Candidatus Sulfopaludibacter sp.]
MKFILFAAIVFAAACGSKQTPEKKAAEAPKAVEYFHVDAATAGTVSGKVEFRGTRPERKLIVMDSDATCQAAHAGHPVYDDSIAIGKGGGLANAFVYIQTGMEGRKFELPEGSVLLNQHGCLFEPRVLGMRAGQMLDVKNSDTVSHNVHPKPTNNYDWNQQQSPGSPDLQHKFPRADVMIPVKCNVHSWMRAYIGVVDHPYFAVTGPDGSFELKNVPPGDYTLAVWQEKLGEQKQTVHLAPSGTAAVNFTYQ